MAAFRETLQEPEVEEDENASAQSSAPAFRLVQRRFGRFSGVSLCPAMDLLCVSEDPKPTNASATLSHKLDLYRSICWDKLSASPVNLQCGASTAIVWSPDGRQLAVGTHTGSLVILDTERGDVRQLERTGNSAVLQLHWCASATPKRSLAERLADGVRQQLAEALPSASLPTELSMNDSQQVELAEESQRAQELPSLLVSMDAEGVLRAYCAAEVPVLEVDVKEAFLKGDESSSNGLVLRALKLNASPDMSDIYALVSVMRGRGQVGRNLYNLRIPVQHVTDHMGGRSEILSHIAKARESAHRALETAKDALQNANRSTEASCRSLGGKLMLLTKLLKDYALVQVDDEEPHAVAEARAIKAAFAEYVRFGEGGASGPAIAAFFGQSWSTGPAMRMAKMANAELAKVSKLVNEALSPSLRRLLLSAVMMRAYSLQGFTDPRNESNGAEVSSAQYALDRDALDACVQLVEEAVVVCERVSREVSKTRHRLSLLFKFMLSLISIHGRTSEGSTDPSEQQKHVPLFRLSALSEVFRESSTDNMLLSLKEGVSKSTAQVEHILGVDLAIRLSKMRQPEESSSRLSVIVSRAETLMNRALDRIVPVFSSTARNKMRTEMILDTGAQLPSVEEQAVTSSSYPIALTDSMVIRASVVTDPTAKAQSLFRDEEDEGDDDGEFSALSDAADIFNLPKALFPDSESEQRSLLPLRFTVFVRGRSARLWDLRAAREQRKLRSQTVTQSEASDTSKRWYYVDPKGKVQGPFPVYAIIEWRRAGFFGAELLTMGIRVGEQAPSDAEDNRFCPLGDGSVLFQVDSNENEEQEGLEEEEVAGDDPVDVVYVSAESPVLHDGHADRKFLAGIRFDQSREIRAARLYASDLWTRNRDEKQEKLLLVSSKPGCCRPFEVIMIPLRLLVFYDVSAYRTSELAQRALQDVLFDYNEAVSDQDLEQEIFRRTFENDSLQARSLLPRLFDSTVEGLDNGVAGKGPIFDKEGTDVMSRLELANDNPWEEEVLFACNSRGMIAIKTDNGLLLLDAEDDEIDDEDGSEENEDHEGIDQE